MKANTPSAGAASVVERDRDADRSELCDAAEGLLWLGASMLRAGNTAFRTRECMDLLAKKLSFDEISVALTFDTVIASVRRAGERVTMAREIGLPGVNAWRIGELEQLAQKAEMGANAQKTAAESCADRIGAASLHRNANRRGGRSRERSICVSQRLRRDGNMGGGRQQRARPVGAVTTGTPTFQPVRGNGAERRRGGRDVCLDSRTERPRRMGDRRPSGRVHVVGLVSRARISARRCVAGPAGASDRRRLQPVCVWHHDVSGRHLRSQHYCRHRSDRSLAAPLPSSLDIR